MVSAECKPKTGIGADPSVGSGGKAPGQRIRGAN